ncbi:hypothetical protein N9N08_00875 [bacterium]|nr:hypothetical protein [bacterium]
MVDSVKNYGIAGVSTTLELGKQGAKIDSSNSDVISIKDKDDGLENIVIADGTENSHAVNKSQYDVALINKINTKTITVQYNDSVVAVGTPEANTKVLKTTVEATTNWPNANSTTEISVGDTADNGRLFSGFDTTTQGTQEINHTYTDSSTVIRAYVTTGGATAGTAKVTVLYKGIIN